MRHFGNTAPEAKVIALFPLLFFRATATVGLRLAANSGMYGFGPADDRARAELWPRG
jgi:hypothetical protein